MVDAGPGFSSYLWSSGETTQSISVGIPNTYCVTVTDPNSCSNSDCVFIDISNGISDLQSNKLFSVYPNPATDILSINFNRTSSNVEIKLMNTTGELVKKFVVENSGQTNVDLSPFSKGIYFLRINADEFSEVQKIILQ